MPSHTVERSWDKPEDGVIAFPWREPLDLNNFTYDPSASPIAPYIMDRWKTLKEFHGTDISMARYARLLSIDSCELESVFLLGGESLPRLVRVGFFSGAIDCVQSGPIHEPQKIVTILKDMNRVIPTYSLNDLLTHYVPPQCLSYFVATREFNTITTDTICNMHKILMASSHIGVVLVMFCVYLQPFE